MPPFTAPKNHRTTTTPKPPLLPTKPRRDSVPSASAVGAVLNLSTTIIGAGIMALPATLKQLGVGIGLFFILIVGVLTERSIEMVLRFTRAARCDSYAGVVGDAFGVGGKRVLQGCVVVYGCGLLVVYMIIIGDVLAGTWSDSSHHVGLMEEWFGQQWWLTRFTLLLLTIILVFAPLISLKRIDSLRYTSALSVGLAIVFVVITAGIAIVKLEEGSVLMPPLWPKLVGQASFWQLFTTIPVLVTAYICHHNIHPIENELKDTSQMKLIVRTSLIICSCVYIATSFFGFLLFGDRTQDDILANFDEDLGIPYSSLLDDVVRMSYCLHLMLVFPIVFFSRRLNVDGLLFPHAIPIAYDNKRFYSLTVALVVILFLGANCVPSIWVAFQFTGATATVSVGFIFPAAVTLRDRHNIAMKKDRLISMVMIFLAVSSSSVAILSDIYSIFTATNSEVDYLLAKHHRSWNSTKS